MVMRIFIVRRLLIRSLYMQNIHAKQLYTQMYIPAIVYNVKCTLYNVFMHFKTIVHFITFNTLYNVYIIQYCTQYIHHRIPYMAYTHTHITTHTTTLTHSHLLVIWRIHQTSFSVIVDHHLCNAICSGRLKNSARW